MTSRQLGQVCFRLFAAFCFLAAFCAVPRVFAEGSISLFPNGATGNRANLEWRTSSYGGGLLKRRTLLRVYANAGEIILVGSSAVGVAGTGGAKGDVVIYRPNEITQNASNPVGQEAVPAYNAATDFAASSQSGKGSITSRAQEVAGANSVTGNANSSGYTPASYTAPITGAYWVVFTGPNGGSDDSNGVINGTIDIGAIGDANTVNNFGAGQNSSVTAWDVTVRPSGTSGPSSDFAGRLFCSYLTMNVGGNGRQLESTLYAVTTDGYHYTVALNGLDPYGFVIYGSQAGFYDSDGKSPLYHDVLAATTAQNQDQLTSIQGGCTLSLPQYPLFFQTPDSSALPGAGVTATATVPVISGLTFAAADGTNNARYSAGGTFHFTSNISAIYDITISGASGSADPTLATNRRLRGVGVGGGNSVAWDGKDNSGTPFPIGTNYMVHAAIHGGEYHFPLIDAENSANGGPSFTMTSRPGGQSNPLGNSTGFYDDRGYLTLGLTAVGTQNTVLPGNGAPAAALSDPVNGFNTTGSQRAYGNGGGSGFGDKKGLDIWTYFPSGTVTTALNVQGAPTLLLVKRITAYTPAGGATVQETGFDNDPGSTTDASAYWPTPSATYLRGVRTLTGVKPGDEIEYTIYFVDTNGPASNITLADVVPANTVFDPASYTGLTPTDGGAAGAASGIALALSTSALPAAPTNYLSNVSGDDRGTYTAAGTQITVTLASLAAATGPGTPAGSYGFLRFRVKVQ